jgi:hypothetical protein
MGITQTLGCDRCTDKLTPSETLGLDLVLRLGYLIIRGSSISFSTRLNFIDEMRSDAQMMDILKYAVIAVNQDWVSLL